MVMSMNEWMNECLFIGWKLKRGLRDLYEVLTGSSLYSTIMRTCLIVYSLLFFNHFASMLYAAAKCHSQLLWPKTDGRKFLLLFRTARNRGRRGVKKCQNMRDVIYECPLISLKIFKVNTSWLIYFVILFTSRSISFLFR